jgi:hypothetical protein
VGDIITAELRLLVSLARSSVVTRLLTLHRNGLHPTRDTTALININLAGG